jgi:hypothetical protein
MSAALQLNPVESAIAQVRKIGAEQLGQDAMKVVGYLANQPTPLEEKVAVGLIALHRITGENSSPRDIAHHLASIAHDFPKALEGALARAANQITRDYLRNHAGLDVIHARKLLEICERWRPMMQACHNIEGRSLVDAK